MKYAELISQTDAELTELERKQQLVQFQKRVRFLLLLKTGAATTQKQAGEMVGWKLRQSQKIWNLYRTTGMSGVLQKNARWQTGKLSNENRAKLCEHLRAVGGAASLKAVQSQIQDLFGVTYTICGVSVMCRRLKIKLKTARPVNIKKSEELVAEYKKTFVR